jgi:SAM-dependent methyltransferase
MPSLGEQFGQIDIYLFDQLLRGRIAPGVTIFDAGCGSGRNLVYFLRERYPVYGIDSDPVAVQTVRDMAASLAPQLPAENFRTETLEASTFPDELADVVIASAVLHFARDDAQFRGMLEGSWRILKPGGIFFARLASSIGIEHLLRRGATRRCLLPDGTERYLVDEPLLTALAAELGGTLLDPIKTTVVHNQRSMTTWVLRKI